MNTVMISTQKIISLLLLFIHLPRRSFHGFRLGSKWTSLILSLIVCCPAYAIVVTNTNDSGAGSLRQAIIDALVDDVITFDPSLSGQTITLTTGELSINKNLTIDASALPAGITISGNNASRVFGIASGIAVTLQGLTIADGLTSGPGGGINNNGNLDVIDCTITGSTSNDDGGGVFNSNSGDLTITGSTISNNTADRPGGGINNDGILTVIDCVVTGNTSQDDGGGLFSSAATDGLFTITGSTIFNNVASDKGGGIRSNRSCNISNTTIVDNTAEGDGGALYVSNSGQQSYLTNSTVVSNDAGTSAEFGGGVYVFSGELIFENSIIAQNTAPNGSDISKGNSGTIINNGGNLIGDNSTVDARFPSGSLVGTASNPLDPMLAPLGDYGGPTQTMPPLLGSPAIDAVVGLMLSEDQRGVSRPQGVASDIGAIESNLDLLVDNNADSGTGSLRSTIETAIPGSTITFDPALGGQTITLTSGELSIDRNLTIDASALPAGLAISGNNVSRVFNIASGNTVTMDNLTVTEGSTSGDGGGILNAGDLTIENSVISNNKASVNGGTSIEGGGGIANSGTITINDCTIDSNTSENDAGGILNHSSGSLIMTGSTVSNNSIAVGGPADTFGGGIRSLGDFNISNCTITGNTSLERGGGVYLNSSSLQPSYLTNSTVVSNDAGTIGGGVYVLSGELIFENSIIAQNTASNGSADIYKGNSGTIRNNDGNLIGDNSSVSAEFLDTDPLVGNSTSPLDPQLAPLGDYGGPTQTMPPAAGSPAIDAGVTTTLTFDFDQRGFSRVVGTVDIGAVETTITDGSPALNVSNVSRVANLTWTGASGATFELFLGTDSNNLASQGNQSSPFNPGVLDFGATYYWRVDTTIDGQTYQGDAYSFDVRGPLVVTTEVDEENNLNTNGISLREAIAEAVAVGLAETITFDAALDGQTIVLGGTELSINGDLAIDASALSSGITISGNNASRAFGIASGIAVTLQGLTIADGLTSGPGGGINNNGNLDVIDCTITGSTSNDDGGGVFNSNSGDLTITGSTISNNEANRPGGGINNDGILTVIDCVVTGNKSQDDGGGLFSSDATDGLFTITGSTIFNNVADDKGGGIRSNRSCNISNTTIVGNTAKDDGGALYVSNSGQQSYLTNSTVVSNDAGTSGEFGGGVYVFSGELIFENSIIAQNTASNGSDISKGNIGTIRNNGRNLIGDNSTVDARFPSGSLVGTASNPLDPMLAPLGDYGGPTQTMPPLVGSPAIDPVGGDALSTLTSDQRGYTRLVDGDTMTSGAILDIGAVEAGPAITVLNANDNGAGSLRQALVDATAPGHRILFDPTLNGQEIDLTSNRLEVGPTQSVFIDGSSLDGGLAISGEDTRQAFYINAGGVAGIHGLTVTNCRNSSGDGGGLANEGVLTLSNMTVSGNKASGGGGGIWNNSAKLSLTNCTVTDNQCDLLGGGIASFVSGNSLTLVHSTIAGNQSLSSDGGGVYAASGILKIENSIVAMNSAANRADIFKASGIIAERGVNLIGDNTSVEAEFPEGPLVGTSTNPLDPLLAPLGDYGGPTQTMALLADSPAIDAGGTIGLATDQRGRARVVDGLIDGAAIPDIGAFEVGTLAVTTSTDSGAGSLRSIVNDPTAERVLFDPSLSGQTITLTSGELLIDKEITIDASNLPDGLTISGNNTSRVFNIASGSNVLLDTLTITEGFTPSGDSGGGIINTGTLTVRNSTLSQNVSGLYGGAIANGDGGVLEVINSTISNNTAAGDSGGIDVFGSSVSLINSTITANVSQSGAAGGVLIFNGTVSLTNTIVAGNRAVNSNDVSGTLDNTSSSNLIGDGTGMFGVTDGNNNNQVGTAADPLDPMLAPLGYYGGSTQTMALLVGSPAIDAGAASALATDQRGFARVVDGDSTVGAVPDIGAVEAVPATLVTDIADSGSGSLREALANATGPGARILFNLSSDSMITLNSGELAVGNDRSIFLDASSLVDASGDVATEPDPIRMGEFIIPQGVIVSGGSNSRVFQVPESSVLAIHSLDVVNGATDQSGGGILNAGLLTLVESTVSGSSADLGGGGLDNTGSVSVIRSTIFDNTATAGPGGGIRSNNSLKLTNSTLTGNLSGGTGGGIHLDGGSAGLEHSTLAFNTASSGGGMYADSGVVELENTIVAENVASSGVDLAANSGQFTSNGGNLIGSNESLTTEFVVGMPNMNLDYVGSAALPLDPLLDDLAFNGGPAPTLRLVSNSPAIDAGVSIGFVPFTDQRGFTRILASGLDIGAYEASAGSFDPAGLTVHAVLNPDLNPADIVFELSTDPNFLEAVTTLVGTGVDGFVDGLSATAQFNYPAGVAQDSAGNLYVADTFNHRIRMITPSGEVSTIAGSDDDLFNFDFEIINGPGSSARFAFPTAIAIGPNGNLYVADTFNHCIRKLTRPALEGLQWNVSTLAGTGAEGYQDGNGSIAQFDSPHGVAVDAMGNVYVGDSENHCIRKVTSGGVVSTFAGTGTAGFVDGVSTTAQLNQPFGLAFDSIGNLFVADRENHSIRMITSNGDVSTFAGTGSFGFQDDLVDGTTATFNLPLAVVVDENDNLFVSDGGNNAIRNITTAGLVSTVAGLGTGGFVDGNSTIAEFDGPAGLILDQRGDLIVADTLNHSLRRVVVDPVQAAVVVGVSGASGTAVSAEIDTAALGLDPTQTYYVRWVSLINPSIQQALGQSFYLPDLPSVITQDASNLRLTAAQLNASVNPGDSKTTVTFEYSTDPSLLGPWQVYTVAGSGLTGSTNAVDPLAAEFNQPQGIAVVGGEIFIADRLNHQIRKVAANGEVSTFAGSTAGFTDATGSAAQFDIPADIAADSSGNLYVADAFNHCIRKITPEGVVTTFAGSGEAGFVDGAADVAEFLYPQGVAVDSDNNVYVADTGNHRIRRIAPDGTVSTFAGNGTDGFIDNTVPSTAQFSAPQGVAIDASGVVYVADTGNYRVRLISGNSVITLAGSGTAGYLDGAGASAEFSSLRGITVDAEGIVYVTDHDNHRIRTIAPDGTVGTLAGSGSAGWLDSPTDELHPATAAEFNLPCGIALDSAGDVYLSESGNEALRKVQRDSVPTATVYPNLEGQAEQLVGIDPDQPLLGGETYYFRPTATNLRDTAIGEILSFTLPQPQLLVYNGPDIDSETISAGDLIDFGAVPKGDAYPSAEFTLYNSGNLELNVSSISVPSGYQLVSDSLPLAIDPEQSLTFEIALMTDIAGVFGGSVEIVSDDPLQGSFTFSVTGEVVAPPVLSNIAADVDATGTGIGFSATVDPMNSATEVVFEYSQSENLDNAFVVSTLAGSVQGFVDDCGTAAEYDSPRGVAIDADGNVYVADTQNHVIRRIGADAVCSILAGSGGVAGFADGSGTAAQFDAPEGLTVDADGNVYVADTGNHCIRRITPEGVVTTLSGTTGGASFTDGIISAARFNQPTDVAVDAQGILYVADFGNLRIRKIDLSNVGSEVSTLAEFSAPSAPEGLAVDNSGTVYIADSMADSVFEVTADGVVTTLAGSLTDPADVAVDTEGNVFVAERAASHVIKRIATDSSVTVIAGAANTPASDDGPGAIARFNQPGGIAVNASGTLVVADTGNHRIRQITSNVQTLVAGTELDGTQTIAVTADVPGLEADTTYYYRAVATNLGGRFASETFDLTLLAPQMLVYNGPDTNSAEISVNDQIDFGVVPEGDASPTTTLTLFNSGNLLPLNVSAINLPSGYELVSVSPPVSVASQDSLTFEIALTTTTGGVFSGSVEILSNDPLQSSFTFTVTGEVLAPPVISNISAAVDGTGTGIDFSATVDPMNSATNVNFEYSQDVNFVSTVQTVAAATGLTGTQPIAVAASATGLQLNATYYYRVRAENAGGIVYSPVSAPVVTREPLTPFMTWQVDNFGADAENDLIAGPNADPSQDSVSNLINYALGRDPNVSSQAGLPTLEVDGGSLVLTYTKVLAATDLLYEVECSTDMVNWITSGITEQVITDDGITQQIEATTSLNTEVEDSTKFMRLRVTLQ